MPFKLLKQLSLPGASRPINVPADRAPRRVDDNPILGRKAWALVHGLTQRALGGHLSQGKPPKYLAGSPPLHPRKGQVSVADQQMPVRLRSLGCYYHVSEAPLIQHISVLCYFKIKLFDSNPGS